MSDPKSVVENYMAAINGRDFDRAREFLADAGFRYTSPIGTYEDADRFIDSLLGVGAILERAQIDRLFLNGEEVMAIVETLTTLSGYRRHNLAIWFRVKDGRIRSMETFFDASEYKQMFAEQFRDPGDG